MLGMEAGRVIPRSVERAMRLVRDPSPPKPPATRHTCYAASCSVLRPQHHPHVAERCASASDRAGSPQTSADNPRQVARNRACAIANPAAIMPKPEFPQSIFASALRSPKPSTTPDFRGYPRNLPRSAIISIPSQFRQAWTGCNPNRETLMKAAVARKPLIRVAVVESDPLGL